MYYLAPGKSVVFTTQSICNIGLCKIMNPGSVIEKLLHCNFGYG